ncbi:IQ domain-containing protein IQM1-like [Mangifera indica]|uniref:IQ domain-containing protein IQM1-like n=1 Tax=Mangifera indica TaxID=29780 RepID=UPI001CFB277E|nr:IQ domain-containing protein IQM1-like [Mangifera indica]
MRAIISFKKRELANELPALENITINLAKLKLQTTEVSAFKNDTLIRDDKAKTDIAVVINGALWWKQMECVALRRSSLSFFTAEHTSETAVSKWERASIRAAKIGKGSSKDEKAQKLVLLHWLEAIDPLHRYGGNLYPYYDVWRQSESNQPFFYWLDIGDGKDVSLEKCSRANLQLQCIKYLGPKEREAYEVIMEKGKLVYKQSRVLVDTPKSSQWIFVLGTSKDFYVGEKKKGFFQHSSFLAGAATMASGRLVAHNGILQAIWPLSGHYRPTEEHFKEFCSFLEDHHIDLTNVKKFDIDEDIAPKVIEIKEPSKSEESVVLTHESIDEAKAHANEMNKDEESMKVLEESAAGSEDCHC